ncbi:glycosyltransferase family 39 protein [Roseomonas sp. KE2513]|uniref:glycosyltransferase family 39 protein n=1 Tax=Roseomonas sp. KE2513 TaxID=2479202 RepID=UPI0018DF8CF2|nr:glycosyltransferase family 39 protein [Roseomonas sp. KE2513]
MAIASRARRHDTGLGGARLLLAGIVLVALGVRFWHLTSSSLWVDEGFSVQVAVLDRARAMELIMADTHPPLYYLALLAWTSVFGAGEFALRSLSVLFGVLTIPVLFSIGRMLVGLRVGLLAAALLATSALHVQYSTEVRMYSLLPLLASVALWGAVRFATAPEERGARLKGAFVFVLGSTLALWTQMAGLFVIPSASLIMLVGWWLGGRGRAAGLTWLLANVVLLGILAASVPVLSVLMANAKGLVAWLPPPTPRVIAETIGPMLAQKLNAILSVRLTTVAAAGFALVAALGLWAARRNPRFLAFAILAGVLPFVLTIAVSFAVAPIFVTRIHLWSLLPLYLLIAAAMVAYGGRVAGFVLVGFVMAAQAAGLYAYHAEWSRPDWRSAVALIAASAGPGDVIVTPPPPGVDAVIGYYAAPLRRLVRPVGEKEQLPDLVAAAEGKRVWAVSSPWHDRVEPAALAEALGRGHRADAAVSFPLVTVQLWHPPRAERR